MKVCFVGPACKTGVPCEMVVNTSCCMDQPAHARLSEKRCYEVLSIADKPDGQYYMFQGWGTLEFNARCFELERLS